MDKNKYSSDMKKQINDLLLKMQTGENCIGETANELLNLYNVSNSEELTIWCNDLDAAEKLWQDVYMPDGWDVKEPIETKWNWKRFRYEYRFKLIKH